jgi:hypothetical protein
MVSGLRESAVVPETILENNEIETIVTKWTREAWINKIMNEDLIIVIGWIKMCPFLSSSKLSKYNVFEFDAILYFFEKVIAF